MASARVAAWRRAPRTALVTVLAPGTPRRRAWIRKVKASLASLGPKDMPFDTRRMFWGGFEPIFDSAKG